MRLFESKKLKALKEAKQTGEAKPYIMNGVKYDSAVWFNSDKEANDFMKNNKEYGVLDEYKGKVIAAKITDKGVKTSEKMTEASLTHGDVIQFFSPKNWDKFPKIWDAAWNANSGLSGAAKYLAKLTGESARELQNDQAFLYEILKDAYYEDTFVDLEEDERRAFIDFLESKGRVRTPKYGLK